MYLIFDTETTGLPENKSAPITDLDNWPRAVQVAWQLHDASGRLLSAENKIVKPEGFTIPFNAEKVHGISTDRALKEGERLGDVLDLFSRDLALAVMVAGHNILDFDIKIIGAEYLRLGRNNPLESVNSLDTQLVSVDYCALPGGRGGQFKWPSLQELHRKLFGADFDDAHDAAYDVAANARCFFELIRIGIAKPAGDLSPDEMIYEAPDLETANFARRQEKKIERRAEVKGDDKPIDSPFVHLHLHSQFSILQATADVKRIVARAKADGMPAIGLTDLGNLFGAFKFVREALANGLKPVLGCEFYIAEEPKKLKFTKDSPDRRFNQVLLAKNKEGYHNLVKLSSLGYTEGYYGLYPRIGKELIEQYSGNLIALSGGLSGEIPSLILNAGEHKAEEALKWWISLFRDDFYLELNRHELPENDRVNEVLLGFAEKYQVKVIAANDVYYLERSEANAHDVLLCIKENELQSTPIGKGRGFRYGFPNDQYYFKSQDEMKALFADVPEAIHNIVELISKVESYQLDREVLLPAFDIPDGFESENDYLRHLTYEGARERYGEISTELRERLDFELDTIKHTGYPGYFLIVQDFTREARKMGVAVGPGRGSAAGSAVAYCIGITNVDPIKYDLLFERFLNPDRVSLPDIDIDFDDEGRGKIIEYVVRKYGWNRVAQIITYGTMAAKSSIRDAARVMELPLSAADELAKKIPERVGTTLRKAFKEVPELEEIRRSNKPEAEILKQALVLEGSVRNTGIHACGVIITPDDLSNLLPVCTSKDSELLVTQFDNSVVEKAGMLKMDFLGLKTLSIIKTAIDNIEKRHSIRIDIDRIPLDDSKTFQLYQRGETNGTFQFESAGMQKYLKALKPDKLEDLIAMNALYRPGPMEYIPLFVARKHGREPINYDLPEMEEHLAETYGITVYQEQVMLLSQKLAGFSKGDADVLRKAMGKKIFELLETLKPKFIQGCLSKGHPVEVAEKIWHDWEAFASYAFNKSHSTCYSIVAYQTAWLKANYPAEYMASVLTHNQSQIDKVTFFMEECRNLQLRLLGPSVNESGIHFEVNPQGEIRFGLGAIKGTGESAVQAIMEERKRGGAFGDIFDFATRVNLRAVNKKTFEVLAMAGAFDCFGDYHRRQYLEAPEGEQSLIEKAIRYGGKVQAEQQAAQQSLFGGSNGMALPLPRVPACEPFGELEKLKLEKEVVGFYLSGHPLDQFKVEFENFIPHSLRDLEILDNKEGKEMALGGIVSDAVHRIAKNGKPYGILTLEDYQDSQTFYLFSDDYLRFRNFMVPGWFLYVQGVVVKKPWGDRLPEFKISNIQLLSDIREKLSRVLKLSVPAGRVDPTMVGQLEALAGRHPGKCSLRLDLSDTDEQISVELLSRKYMVNPDDELLRALSEIDDLQYRLHG